MSTPQGQPGPGPGGSSGLPDFSSGAAAGGSGSGGGGQGPPGGPDGGRRTPWIVAGVVGGGALLILVVVLILTQTVFRSALDPNTPAAGPTTIEEQSPEGDRPSEEFIPTAPAEPTEAPPPPEPSLTGLPSAPCTVSSRPGTTQQEDGWVAGGDLRFRTTETFDNRTFEMRLPYTYDVNQVMAHVEANWYSAIAVGGVDFGGEDYDLKEGAEVLMQCYVTSSMIATSGGSIDTTTFSSDPITVDGHDAWKVTTTYELPDDYLSTTGSAQMVVVLVDTGDGYSLLFSDVAPNIPEHADGQQFAIDTLEVV